MTIKQFILTGLDAGWEPKSLREEFTFAIKGGSWIYAMGNYYELLDPDLWKAVGKVKKWSHLQVPDIEYKDYAITEEWQFRMYMMINALISGKTLEEYIATL